MAAVSSSLPSSQHRAPSARGASPRPARPLFLPAPAQPRALLTIASSPHPWTPASCLLGAPALARLDLPCHGRTLPSSKLQLGSFSLVFLHTSSHQPLLPARHGAWHPAFCAPAPCSSSHARPSSPRLQLLPWPAILQSSAQRARLACLSCAQSSVPACHSRPALLPRPAVLSCSPWPAPAWPPSPMAMAAELPCRGCRVPAPSL
ncbi:uncharacterized protein [Zea mays]|jgi:hypothetical protein|uniref:Uncharacterized protein n=1 Tax=Zea mays TaxID=4577 RepID=B4FLI0_MAIZE|nr:uncharacterized protein LOC100217121 [Zea mays]XP_035821596.1 uncharacterized protein LOC100217121 isoform X1 [Zea mays]ACF82973.1 unknown [Zea mays]|eukprot:NP_001136961.1 uncharacterized protein LOC100217121 [Zea mays]